MALVIDKLIMGLTKMRNYNMAVLTEKQIKYGTVLERPELYEK